MTSFSLQSRHLAYWEDRLRKESLAVSMHHGAPHHDRRDMHSFLAADRELGPLARGNWTIHRTKSRASLAWQDYAQGKNPVTGYDTRYRLDSNLPFFPPRSAEARRPATSETTNAFPAEPRMRCARGGASNHMLCRACAAGVTDRRGPPLLWQGCARGRTLDLAKTRDASASDSATARDRDAQLSRV